MDFVRLLHPVIRLAKAVSWCTYMDFVRLLHPEALRYDHVIVVYLHGFCKVVTSGALCCI